MFLNELHERPLARLRKINRVLKEVYNYNIDYNNMTAVKAHRMINKINERNISDKEEMKYKLIVECLHLWTESKFQSELTSYKSDNENSLLTEGLDEESVDSAKVIIAAQEISDNIQKMIENVAKMQVQDLLPIVDAMKDEIGEDESRSFSDEADKILGNLLNGLKETRQSFDTALSSAQGNSADDMGIGGDEFGMPGEDDISSEDDMSGDDDIAGLEGLDGMDDDFGGDDGSIADEEPSGRELKDDL